MVWLWSEPEAALYLRSGGIQPTRSLWYAMVWSAMHSYGSFFTQLLGSRGLGPLGSAPHSPAPLITSHSESYVALYGPEEWGIPNPCPISCVTQSCPYANGGNHVTP